MSAETRLATYGYVVDVFVFESKDLKDHWARLDAFEGEGYRRVVIDVETPEGQLRAYIYISKHKF